MRKPHSKAKTGCLQCRRRRIKCLEEKPTCSQCQRHSLACKYEPVRRSTALSSLSDVKEQTSNEVSISSTSVLNATSKVLDINLVDLELLHFYTGTTYRSFASPMIENQEAIWLTQVPQMAFASKYLMHGLLATSALHMSKTQPHRSDGLLKAAAAHEAMALPYYREASQKLDRSNAGNMFVFAAFVVAYASGMDETNDNTFPPRWLLLLRSSLALLSELYQNNGPEMSELPSKITAAQMESTLDISAAWVPAAAFSRPHAGRDQRTYEHANTVFNGVPHADHGNPNDIHILNLTMLFDTPYSAFPDMEEELKVYHSTMTGLRWCNALMFHHPLNHTIYRCQAAAFVWPRFVSSEYMQLLTERKPKAMILLAHYAAMLSRAEFSWYFRGQARKILSSIISELEEQEGDWDPWLAWPKGEVFRNEEPLEQLDMTWGVVRSPFSTYASWHEMPPGPFYRGKSNHTAHDCTPTSAHISERHTPDASTDFVEDAMYGQDSHTLPDLDQSDFDFDFSLLVPGV